MIKRFKFTSEFYKSIMILSRGRKAVALKMMEILIGILENKKRVGERNVWIDFDDEKNHWVAWTSVKTLLIFRAINLSTILKEWEIRGNSCIKVDYLQSEDFVTFFKVEYFLYKNSMNRVLQSPRYPYRLKEDVFVIRRNENKCKFCKKQIVDNTKRKYCEECALIAQEKNLIHKLLRWHKSEIARLEFSCRGIERAAKEAIQNHGIEWFESRVNVYEQYHFAEKWAFWQHIVEENTKIYWKKFSIWKIQSIADEMNEYCEEYNLILKKGVIRQRSFGPKHEERGIVFEPEPEPGFKLFSLPSKEDLINFAERMAPYASMGAPYK